MKVLIAILSLVIGTSAFAECNTAYKDQLKVIEGRMNPPRTTIISNVIAEGTVVGALAVAGTIPVTAVVALPAAAIGAGAYYGYLAIDRTNLRNAMHLISEAHKGKGPTLTRFLKLLKKKSKYDVTDDEAINILLQGDFDNVFCELNEVKDTYKLMGFQKILHFTKNKIADGDY